MNQIEAIEALKNINENRDVKFKFVAMDYNCQWFAFKSKPRLRNGIWQSDDLFKEILVDFKNSLAEIEL